MTAEAGKNGNALAAVGAQPEWSFTPEEKEAIRKTYAPGATPEQFTIFWAEAMRRKLMPGRQLFFRLQRQKEWDEATRQRVWVSKAIHITGIDAFRLIAQRTGRYAGQQPVVWIYLKTADGGFTESTVPNPNMIPYAARVTVLRHDFSEPLAAIARWDAYVQTYENDKRDRVPNPMWARMGPEQLAKCAEALALRKAFPEDLWGLYIPEEFPENPDDDSSPQPQPGAAVPPAVPAAPAAVSNAPAMEEGKPAPAISETEMENHSAAESEAPKKKVDRPSGRDGAKWYIREVLDKEGVKGGGELMKAFLLRSTGAKDTKSVTETQWATALALLDTVLTSAGPKQVVALVRGEKKAA